MEDEKEPLNLAGIPEELAARAGLRHVDALQAKDLCGLDQSGLWIPYIDRNGAPITFENSDGDVKDYGRLRMDRPDPTKKYHQEMGSAVQLYIPQGVTTVDVIVEGEKKALALWGIGIHAVGISGFYGYSKSEGGKRVLLQALSDLLVLKGGGEIQFLGDTDTSHNPQFSDAAIKLLELLPQDCSLTIPRLPIDGPKGVDDCIGAWGDEARERWISTSHDPITLDRELHKEKQGAAELVLSLLRSIDEELLRLVMDSNPRVRRRVYICIASAAASPSSQETAIEWLRDLTGTGKRAFNAELKLAKEEFSSGLGQSLPEITALIQQVADSGYTLKAKYLYPIEGNLYAEFSQDELRREIMAKHELTAKPCPSLPGGLSQVDLALQKIKTKPTLCYSGAVAGYQTGIYDVMGVRFLVTHGYDILKGEPGDWSMFREVIERFCGRDAGETHWEIQYDLVMAHMKQHRRQLLFPEEDRPGHFLAFVGEPGAGKTWWQATQLPKLLTNRAFFQDSENLSSQFNAEMGVNELIVLSDSTGSTDYHARDRIADILRKLVGNPQVSVEKKGVDRVNLPVKQRVIASANINGMGALPPLKEGIQDKVIYLKVHRIGLWDGSDDPKGAEITAILDAQRAAFCHAIDNFRVPEALYEPRFGCLGWQHPELVEEASTGRPWEPMVEYLGKYLQRCLTGYVSDVGEQVSGCRGQGSSWLSASELYQEIVDGVGIDAFEKVVRRDKFPYHLRHAKKEDLEGWVEIDYRRVDGYGQWRIWTETDPKA